MDVNAKQSETSTANSLHVNDISTQNHDRIPILPIKTQACDSASKEKRQDVQHAIAKLESTFANQIPFCVQVGALLMSMKTMVVLLADQSMCWRHQRQLFCWNSTRPDVSTRTQPLNGRFKRQSVVSDWTSTLSITRLRQDCSVCQMVMCV